MSAHAGAASRAMRVAGAVGLAALFVALFCYRLATAAIANDDYLHLSTAQQVLLGAVPVRDFLDPGELLFYSTSAAAQAVLGRSMLSEVLLDAFMLSLGQVLVVALEGWRGMDQEAAKLACAAVLGAWLLARSLYGRLARRTPSAWARGAALVGERVRGSGGYGRGGRRLRGRPGLRRRARLLPEQPGVVSGVQGLQSRPPARNACRSR